MIVLYSALLLCLGVLKFLVDRRANRLVKKHSRVAQEAERLARVNLFKEAGGNRPDAFLAAKRQFQLGQVVNKRDRIETKYDVWQMRSDRLKSLISAIRGWKGKTIPYTFGVLDVGGILYLVDHLGFGRYANIRGLVQMVTMWVNS